MKAKETVTEYSNNHLNQVYLHSLPRWLQLIIFMYRGMYNGFTNFRLSRSLCILGKHSWTSHLYEKYVDDEIVSNYTQCNRCGMPSEYFKVNTEYKTWELIEEKLNGKPN